MKKELEVLHIRAFKWKKRTERLAAVLICGVPGCGKSHLARQYVWTRRDDYPGGIFWVDAKSKESTEKCFWDIAQAAALTDGNDFEDPSARASNRYVDAVRKWFEEREEWLLIFDGISFSRDADISLFRQFLPFNRRCTIIYTSVDKTLSKKSRLFEPYGLNVAPLDVDDACKLLFRDLGIKRPTPEQARKAKEIVKHYECLPLAIHAISHRLSATSKPIEKYHLTSHLTDEKLAEPFLGIMHDLYRAMQYEALNLINLLSFFSHHIPVAFITLGSSALEAWRVEILTSSRSGDDPDIDTTLGTLIKHGLIERFADVHVLLPKDSFQQSSDGDSPVDLKAVTPELSESQSSQSALMAMYQHSGTIDVIKIHSVVQGFCRDELTIMDRERKSSIAKGNTTFSEGFYNSWLIVATKVFCKSYETAKVKMQGLPDSGLVKDYREYETHASRLLEHFPKRISKTSHSEVSVFQARAELKHALEGIRKEIARISPSSSQESLGKHKSVFDRSGSSSSSVPGSSTDEGPSRQPTMDCQDLREMAQPGLLQSRLPAPLSAVAASSQRLNLSPFPPHIYRAAPMNDGGYETDGEDRPRPSYRFSPTLSGVSDITPRPPGSRASSLPRSRAPSPPVSYEPGEWHIVQPKSQKEERPRKKKRGFPSYFQGARAKTAIPPLVKVSSVQGEGSSSRSSRTTSSDSTVIASEAAKALAAVHLASAGKDSGPTYATVVAGRANETASLTARSSPWFGPRRSPLALTLQTQSSRESLRSRISNLQPSPLAADTMSQSMYCAPMLDPSTVPGALDPSSLPGSRHDSRRPSTAMLLDRPVDLSASTPAALTYMPPIQYEENIAFTISRRMGSTPVPVVTEQVISTLASSVAHPSAFMPGTSPPNIVPQGIGGSASDPTVASRQMSRGPSGRSEESRATEPSQLPSRYVRMYATSSTSEAALVPSNVPSSVFQQPIVLEAGSWARDAHQHQQQQQQQSSLPHVSLGFGPLRATRPAGKPEGPRRNSK